MPLIDNAYKDAGLTLQFDSATDRLSAQAVSAGSGDGVIYIGTPNAANKIQDSTDPGINNIEVSVLDLDAGVEFVDAADIKLALSQAGLGAAVGGDPLSLGATILGGAGNAVAVWYRWTNGTGQGTYTDIELVISERIESAI